MATELKEVQLDWLQEIPAETERLEQLRNLFIGKRFKGNTKWSKVEDDDGNKPSGNAITIFYQSAAPTSGMQANDYWLDSDDNKLYRFSGSAWLEVQDDDIATAIANAATAQSTADGKIVTFIQASAPTAEGTGDIWFDSDDDNKPYRWSGSAWVAAEFDVATWTKILGIPSALFQIFYQATAPASGQSTGDYWVDSDDNKVYRYNGSAWAEIQDDDIATAITNAATAQTAADTAQAEADRKIVTFIQASAPTAEQTGDSMD